MPGVEACPWGGSQHGFGATSPHCGLTTCEPLCVGAALSLLWQCPVCVQLDQNVQWILNLKIP